MHTNTLRPGSVTTVRVYENSLVQMFTSFVPVAAILVWTARDELQNRGRLLTRPHFGQGEICLSNELPTLHYSPTPVGRGRRQRLD